MAAAAQLFSRQGYGATAMRQIFANADVVPASLYDHFASKKDLGLAYLQAEEQRTLADLQTLMQQYPDPQRFLQAWVALKRRQIAQRKFFGCPFARFSMNLESPPDTAFARALRRVAQRWRLLLLQYFRAAARAGWISPEADLAGAAKEALCIYQGAIAMWRLSGDARYFQLMKSQYLQLYDRLRSGRPPLPRHSSSKGAGNRALALKRS